MPPSPVYLQNSPPSWSSSYLRPRRAFRARAAMERRSAGGGGSPAAHCDGNHTADALLAASPFLFAHGQWGAADAWGAVRGLSAPVDEAGRGGEQRQPTCQPMAVHPCHHHLGSAAELGPNLHTWAITGNKHQRLQACEPRRASSRRSQVSSLGKAGPTWEGPKLQGRGLPGLGLPYELHLGLHHVLGLGQKVACQCLFSVEAKRRWRP